MQHDHLGVVWHFVKQVGRPQTATPSSAHSLRTRSRMSRRASTSSPTVGSSSKQQLRSVQERAGNLDPAHLAARTDADFVSARSVRVRPAPVPCDRLGDSRRDMPCSAP